MAHWVFIAVRVLSLVAVSRGYLRCCAWASHCSGFSCCGAWAVGSRASVVAARGLSSCGLRALESRLSSCGAVVGLVAPRHVGSSRTRARTCVPCIGRRILNHCTTREAQHYNSSSLRSCYLLHGALYNVPTVRNNSLCVSLMMFL